MAYTDDKDKFPHMTNMGSIEVEKTGKYTLVESVDNNFKLRELAESISENVLTPFILYDCDNTLYTDNQDVLQILKLRYTDIHARTLLFKMNELSNRISFDKILFNNGESFELRDYQFKWKWYIVYRELATLLFKQQDIINPNIKYTVGERLYNTLANNAEFIHNNKWINNFNKVKSLDPVHIFASINNNKLSDKNRTLRIKTLFEILSSHFMHHSISYHIRNLSDEIDFSGCPAPMIVYMISARNQNAQSQIWKMFSEVFKKSQATNIDFKVLKKWYGLDISSFTIFLFWIDSKNFLPLDKYTQSLLYKYKKLETFPQEYKNYKALLTKENTKLYLNLALIANNDSKQEVPSMHERLEISRYLGTDEATNNMSFKVIAIKALEGCELDYLKTLKEDEYYIFDKAYAIKENQITIEKGKDISLFDLENVNLNVNAIVGKNGTGKSTIVELIFALVNNISFICKLNKDIIEIKGLNIESIYKTQYIYKIKLVDDNLQVFQYKNDRFEDCTDKLNSRYRYHKDIALELLNKQQDYSYSKITEISKIIGKTKKEIKKDLFGKEIFEGDLHEKPFTKLKRDIYFD